MLCVEVGQIEDYLLRINVKVEASRAQINAFGVTGGCMCCCKSRNRVQQAIPSIRELAYRQNAAIIEMCSLLVHLDLKRVQEVVSKVANAEKEQFNSQLHHCHR